MHSEYCALIKACANKSVRSNKRALIKFQIFWFVPTPVKPLAHVWLIPSPPFTLSPPHCDLIKAVAHSLKYARTTRVKFDEDLYPIDFPWKCSRMNRNLIV